MSDQPAPTRCPRCGGPVQQDYDQLMVNGFNTMVPIGRYVCADAKCV